MTYNYQLFFYLFLLPFWVSSQCNQTLEDDNSIYVGCLNFEGIPHGKGKLLITFDDQTQTQEGIFENGEFLSGEFIVDFLDGEKKNNQLCEFSSGINI
ncbi:MAG: hypothetical protein CM15mP101_00910 [Flavobacteriaceae bacterium]|nr:MAG: hypothetical protein CM15mP101_00910 [Flavobacteriaceae bacterium]